MSMNCYKRPTEKVITWHCLPCEEDYQEYQIARDRKMLTRLTELRALEPRRQHRHLQWYQV